MATSSGDAMVLATQHWLNTTYKDYVSDGRFSLIEENGKTGWATIYGLTKALQIELGISPTANNFGPTTIKKFNERYPKGVERSDGEKNNVFAIIQGALWCKGYNPGHYSINTPVVGIVIDNQFDEKVENAIKKLQADAGRKVQTGVVDLNIMKALLSMDYFVCSTLYGGDSKIQEIQQYLNGEYEDYIGLCPCDGVYGRKTNTALIYAIQAEEGMATSVANGNFGPSTKRCCPTIPYKGAVTKNGQTWQVKYNNGLEYTTSQLEKFIKLMNMALYVNGIGNSAINSDFSISLINEFQHLHALPITGVCDLTTWLSMFISCGDTEREAKACDCATILTVEKAKTLYDNGYRYVGRYLSNVEGGMDKALTKEELEIAFNAGLRIFPIHQLSANSFDYFTIVQGHDDAISAYDHAKELNIPEKTTIYFAVDCDPQDSEIRNYIIPYFKEIYETMRDSNHNAYKIGVYGTRNVCTQVSDAGYATTSFVCDMSTGFSGNLGFPLPKNWAFDQFATVSVGSGNGKISIDKDSFSGRDYGITKTIDTIEPDYSIQRGYDTTSPQPQVMINVSSKPFKVYAGKAMRDRNLEPGSSEIIDVAETMNEDLEHTYLSYQVAGAVVGEIQPGDFFIWYYCRDNEEAALHPQDTDRSFNQGDAVHKVKFRTNDGVIRYGYIQEMLNQGEWNLRDSRRNGRENFYLYNFDPERNRLISNNKVNPIDAEFITQVPLNYIKRDGFPLGVLPKGTKLKGMGSAGVKHDDYAYFYEIYNEELGKWQDLNALEMTGAFVELGMQYGVNGFDRAIW